MLFNAVVYTGSCAVILRGASTVVAYVHSVGAQAITWSLLLRLVRILACLVASTATCLPCVARESSNVLATLREVLAHPASREGTSRAPLYTAANVAFDLLGSEKVIRTGNLLDATYGLQVGHAHPLYAHAPCFRRALRQTIIRELHALVI